MKVEWDLVQVHEGQQTEQDKSEACDRGFRSLPGPLELSALVLLDQWIIFSHVTPELVVFGVPTASPNRLKCNPIVRVDKPHPVATLPIPLKSSRIDIRTSAKLLKPRKFHSGQTRTKYDIRTPVGVARLTTTKHQWVWMVVDRN
jgi:hypothetical protein